ncbi:MAG: alcohol dehydrogenase catalytic domain-containing protein [Caldilineaceae bacterium]|nr:alcohol dehydrogenase catalytic domain-containing protein [Caldilineaceae bacterium]HRJ45477.1 alcohol dehydrogenase catalytic domain-containing protein [Caldilineaceae bacterium]
MKALRLHGIGDLRLHEEPLPVPIDGEVLLRVTAVGICGSDLHWFEEGSIGDARLAHPLVLGHEFAGVIESGPRKGERVAVDPALPCWQCEYCETGYPNFCRATRFSGHGKDDGSLREFMAWPERALFPLPDSISDVDGALLEPLGVALYALDLGQIRVGDAVGIFGCGPIGLMLIRLARLNGARQIVATDLRPHRLAGAEQMGADVTLLADAGGSERAAVLDATRGRGIDVAFEIAGVNAAVETAMETARPGARVVLVGIPADDRTSFCASTARRKGLTIQLCRRMAHTYPRSIALAASGQIDLASLASHCFPLAEYQRAFATAAAREGLKVVIEP